MRRLIWDFARGETGFGLIEALVTMTILAGGVFAAMGPLTNSMHGSATAQQVDQAVVLGQKALEEMRDSSYADLATVPASNPPAILPGDPRQLLQSSGSVLSLPSIVPGVVNNSEDVVQATANTTFKDVQDVVVSGTTMRLYRFVTWDDEECPIVDLSNLEGMMGSVKTLLGTTTTLLNSLVGPGGNLTGSISTGNSLLGNSLLGALLSPVTSLVTTLLTPINTLLTNPNLLTPSNSLLAKLNSALNPVTGHLTGILDLCDLPKGAIPDLGQLSVIKSTLTALNPILNTLNGVVDPLLDTLNSLTSLNLLNALGKVLAATAGITSAVTNLGPILSGLNTVLGGVVDTVGHPTQLATLLTSTVTSITTLVGFLLNPNTTHNLKRVSVAVWIADRKVGFGPNKPIWLSTTVADPSEGLL